MKDIKVNGKSNQTAGRDIHHHNNNFKISDFVSSSAEIFLQADNIFKSNIIPSGRIRRGTAEIEYSSESLFTSLMVIGIPYSSAINIPFNIIPILENFCDEKEKREISTADIRVAVAKCIDVLRFDARYTKEAVSMWSTAYVRRYGNPNEGSVRVIDNDKKIEVNYKYVKNKIIPHLLRRIISFRNGDPIEIYKTAFPRPTVDIMAKQIVRFTNSLNLFNIRYKTLLHLLEDLILEPPHPWIVNRKTKDITAEYNIERAAHHLDLLYKYQNKEIMPLLNRSSGECVMHLCAAILAMHGGFLGVDSRYGTFELKRVLELKEENLILWRSCELSKLDDNLEKVGCSVDSLLDRIEALNYHMSRQDDIKKYQIIYEKSIELGKIVNKLALNSYESNKKLSDILAKIEE